MKLLVTGASGFIGRNLLLGVPRDWDVTAVWNRDESFTAFVREKALDHVKPVRADLGDTAAAAALGNHDACVFLAANGDPARSVAEPAMDLRANAASLVHLLDGCRFGHLLFFSSGAVYDGLTGTVNPSRAVCPTLPYAISKFAAERYAAHAAKKGRVGAATAARFFGAYGPYEAPRKIYGRLVRQFAIERSPRYTLRGDGRNMIDAMYVDDTVRAILAILARPGEGGTLDLHSGAPMTLKDLVERAARRFGIEPRIEYEGEVPEYNEFRSDDRTMQARYGWTPAIGLGEGLGMFCEWMRRERAPAGTA